MDARTPRDGKVIEELGYYDPLLRDTDARAILNGERIDYWLSVGALPTAKVGVLIKKYGKNGGRLAEQQAALERLSTEKKQASASAISSAKAAAQAQAQAQSSAPAKKERAPKEKKEAAVAPAESAAVKPANAEAASAEAASAEAASAEAAASQESAAAETTDQAPANDQ
jgi:small subunit ribosomal protein S16